MNKNGGFISKSALKKIEELNKLSLKANKTKNKLDDYTLKSMKEHADEIKQLFFKNDPHWAVETGDLMIHCMKILRLHGYNLNKISLKSCKRFENKLLEKIQRSG